MAEANRKVHQKNNRFYDRKAKVRYFEENDLVYLYNPAMKAGLTRKFGKFWSGSYKVIRRIFELNYEIVSQDNRKQIVHINWLKRCYNGSLWNPRPNQKTLKKVLKQKTRHRDSGEDEEEGFVVGPFPLVIDDMTLGNHCTTPQSSNLHTSDTDRQTLDTPSPSKDDPSYCLLNTPRSCRELQTTREEPPITRARARNMLQDVNNTWFG